MPPPESLCRELDEIHKKPELHSLSFLLCDFQHSAQSDCMLCCVVYDSIMAHIDKIKGPWSPEGVEILVQIGAPGLRVGLTAKKPLRYGPSFYLFTSQGECTGFPTTCKSSMILLLYVPAL